MKLIFPINACYFIFIHSSIWHEKSNRIDDFFYDDNDYHYYFCITIYLYFSVLYMVIYMPDWRVLAVMEVKK